MAEWYLNLVTLASSSGTAAQRLVVPRVGASGTAAAPAASRSARACSARCGRCGRHRWRLGSVSSPPSTAPVLRYSSLDSSCEVISATDLSSRVSMIPKSPPRFASRSAWPGSRQSRASLWEAVVRKAVWCALGMDASNIPTTIPIALPVLMPAVLFD